MQLTIIGSGNIGLVSALSFCELGFSVFCIDNDQDKIANLKKGLAAIHEPQLVDFLTRHLYEKSIQFDTQLNEAVRNSDFIFIAIGTPNGPGDEADLTGIFETVEKISALTQDKKYIIIKSTVPPGTNALLQKKYAHTTLEFISNPEFLREGSAFHDNLNPDRIVIGTDKPEVAAKIKNLFARFNVKPDEILTMSPASAELTKYVANVMLANRISLMNEMSELCDRVGADIEQIRSGVGSDKRIGPDFLKAGLGYGGSCFPKDIRALNSFAKKQDLHLKITAGIEEVNQEQLAKFARKIISYSLESDSKCVTLWGASFKPETNDLRESPALKLMALLRQEGLKVQIYDPVCSGPLQALFTEASISVFPDKYEALQGSSALVLCTEWTEFILADKLRIKQTLLAPVIFDGRNIFEPGEMKDLRFIYTGIGRNS